MRAMAVSCCCLSRPSSNWGSTARATSVSRARTRESPSSPFCRNRSCAPRAANVSTDTLKRCDAAIKDSKLTDYLRVTSTIIACEFRAVTNFSIALEAFCDRALNKKPRLAWDSCCTRAGSGGGPNRGPDCGVQPGETISRKCHPPCCPGGQLKTSKERRRAASHQLHRLRICLAPG